MDILYLLIPLSAVLVLAIIGVFGWALHGGQFDDLEQHGELILLDDPADAPVVTALDAHQAATDMPKEESVRP
jgi:cbb3-type cytochrome oxidase maturation protein